MFTNFPELVSEAEDLKSRAINVRDNYQSISTKQEDCDTGEVKSGDADWDAATQEAEAVAAAVWLYAVTGMRRTAHL